MTLEHNRYLMVEQQIRPWDVQDQTVLELLYQVKREEYVPAAHREIAFVDVELPLGDGEVMLAPRVEARMLQELAVRNHEKALEIGTGSGYFTSLLAHRCQLVKSLEINPRLADQARVVLKDHGVANANVITADAFAPNALQDGDKFDVIALTGSVPEVPQVLLQRLNVGGRMAIVVGDLPIMSFQIITRTETGFSTRKVLETVLPPLHNPLVTPKRRFA